MSRVSIAALGLLWAASCGYRFRAGGSPLPEGIRAVYAPVFSNRTAEPGLEVIFTQAFREQLARAGVQGQASCAARVEGELLTLTGNPTILTPAGALASYRVAAQVHLKLTQGERLLADAVVSGAEDYLPYGGVLPGATSQGDILPSEANRQAAIRRLADALMRDGYERLARGW